MADKWDQFEPVGAEQDWSAFEEMQPAQETLQAPTQEPPETVAWKTRAEEVWNKIRGMSVGEGAVGTGELALTAGTSLLGTVAGGYAGLTAASANPIPRSDPGFESRDRENYMEGRPTFTSQPDPTATVQDVQSSMTYQPRTEAGQTIQEAIAPAFEKYEQVAYDIASGAGDPEHIIGATGAYTALMMLPAVFGMNRLRRGSRKKSEATKEAPTSETLRQEAGRLYAEADNAGASVRSESFDGALRAIERRLYDEGFDKALHPDTFAALNNLKSKAGNNQTLKGVELNRQVINEARGALKQKDARMAGIMMDTYDDWMHALRKTDMLEGDASAVGLYDQARGLWHRKMKSDEIEWAIERANIRADANYSGAAFETAVKQEFAAILKNKKRRRMFNEEELASIRSVVDGSLPQRALRLVGKVAPRGVVSGAPGAAIMTVNPALGALVWATGEGAKRGATAMTARGAQKTAELMRRGGQQ